MSLSPSAHVDTFCRDNLPPETSWPRFEFTLPELRYPRRLNCATALLDDVVAEHGADRPCVLSEAERWSYGDLLRRANQVAQVLTEDLGLVPGNRVLLRGPNNPWLLACWFGVLKAGGVVVTTMPLLRSGELRGTLELTKAGIALCDHRYTDELAGAIASLGGGVATVAYGGGGDSDLVAAAGSRSGRPHRRGHSGRRRRGAGATSGTTGVPKATMHFHRDVLAVADTFSCHVHRTPPGGRVHRHATPGLHLRARGPGGLPDAGRAPRRCCSRRRHRPTSSRTPIAGTVSRCCFTAPTAYRAMLARSAVRTG